MPWVWAAATWEMTDPEAPAEHSADLLSKLLHQTFIYPNWPNTCHCSLAFLIPPTLMSKCENG